MERLCLDSVAEGWSILSGQGLGKAKDWDWSRPKGQKISGQEYYKLHSENSNMVPKEFNLKRHSIILANS